MILTVVSGKGGAGKTTLAVSIAEIFLATFYDLDVDAPDSEYFLQPRFSGRTTITQPTPVIDDALCNGCGACTKECRFNALYRIPGQVFLNPSLCHGCELCRIICPQKAIHHEDTAIGTIRSGFSSRTGNQVHIGDLQVGSPRATPLIAEIAARIDTSELSVIDGPPGNSCAAVAAIKPADLVVLVAEPTPFGLHDMAQTQIILNKMQKRYLLIFNKMQQEISSIDCLNKFQCKPVFSIGLEERYHRANLKGAILSREFPDIRSGLYSVLSREL